MSAAYRYRPAPGSRLAAAVLSLAICAIIVLMLIRMGLLAPGGPKVGQKLTAVDLRPPPAESTPRKTQRAKPRNAQAQRTVQPRPTPQEQPRTAPVPPLPFIKMTREEFAAADISKLGKRPAAEAGDASGAAAGPGEGPGGARLYNAEWYREPTDAELVTYMPRRDVAGGWAMIACKTIERNRVEDCRELGESPPGSGLARALRQASWQFLVRPPRIDGKPQLGVWVRIRFDFTKAKRDEGGI